MSYLLCKDCGNNNLFHEMQKIRISTERKHIFYGNTDDDDYYSQYDEDTDVVEKFDLTCEQCESVKVLKFETEKEKASYIYKHTRPGLTWSKKVLPEKQRSPHLFKKFMENYL
jgi:hypothetical protein